MTPALSALLLPEHVDETETWVVRGAASHLQPVLRTSPWQKGVTRRRRRAFCSRLPVVGVRSLGLEFLPKLEEGNLWIRATMPATISLEEGNGYANRMRKLIDSFPEVETVVSQHGRPDDGTDAAGFFNAEFFAPLKPVEPVAPRASTRTS